jgi:hypothetical protein
MRQMLMLVVAVTGLVAGYSVSAAAPGDGAKP